MPRICWNNFTGGEVAKTLTARWNLERFPNFSQAMANMLPGLHGDAARRPGTKYVATLPGYSVLIPFSFNAEPENNFVLVFSDHALRVSNGRDNLSEPIAAPYAAEDLLDISWGQVGDVVYLAHQEYALHKVTRSESGTPGVYAWGIEEAVLNQSLDAPAQPTVTFSSGTGYTLRYKVVAVDANGRHSLPSPAGEVNGKHPSDWTQGNHATITWQAVDGATEYNVYREEAGYYGFIGITEAGSATGGTVSGLKVGAKTASLEHYSGSITRTRVVGNGHVPDSDSTSNLTVASNASQNAFVVDGMAFIYVTKTATTTTWTRSYDPDYGTETWTSSTSSSTEKFWVMVTYSGANPAGTYSTYSTGSLGSNAAYPSGTVSLYTVSPVFSGASTLTFIDNNYEADTSDTPREDWDPFADGNNPGVVAFHQQRMVLAGCKKDPSYFYMSRTGDFENFRKSRPLQDDDPIEYMIASGSINAVTWAASFGDLLLGTTGAEYKATGDNGVITPKISYVTAQSYWGSAGLAPLIIGNSVLHMQRHGSRVRDLYYSLEKDGYAGNDLSILAPHLFEGHTIRQWAYQQTPGSHVWCVRDDGLLLALTYLKEQQIEGWSRHPTDGAVQSVAVISGEDNDALLLVVKRRVNNVDRYFLERLADPFDQADDIADAYFVDCGKTQRTQTPTDTMTGLNHLEGRELAVLADGSPVEGCVVQDGSITIPYEAKVIHAGLSYTSVLSPLPMETQTQQGVTLGKARGYGKVVARLFRSVGGRYGATLDTLYDFPWRPETWGGPCEPYTGDLECTPHGGQATDTSVWLVQERPLPWHVVAIMADVDLAEV